MMLKYRPTNLIVGVVTSIPIFSFAGFGAYVTDGIKLLVPFIILVILFWAWFINRRVVLSDNEIQVTNGFKSSRIQFKEISLLNIGTHRPKFSKVSVPALKINSSVNKRLINILYLPYRKKDLAAIVNFILAKYTNIRIDKEVRAILNMETTLAETRFNRSNLISIIIAIIGTLLYLIYLFFARR